MSSISFFTLPVSNQFEPLPKKLPISGNPLAGRVKLPQRLSTQTPPPIISRRIMAHTTVLQPKPLRGRIRIPSWAWSETQTLGNRHFHHFLSEYVREKEHALLIIAHFSQRKFPSWDSMDESIAIPKTYHILKGKGIRSVFSRSPLVNENRQAVSASRYRPWLITLFEDVEISHVFSCSSYSIEGHPAQPTYVGIYEDGKSMIQQTGMRKSKSACLKMLKRDMSVSCEKEHLDHRLTLTNLTIDQVEAWIKHVGPILATFPHPQLGNHTLIIDKIDGKIVNLRDPFHGWRIAISTLRFFDLTEEITFEGISRLSRSA